MAGEAPRIDKDVMQLTSERDKLNEKASELIKANKENIQSLKNLYEKAREARKLRDDKNKIVIGLKEKKNSNELEFKKTKTVLDELEAKLDEIKRSRKDFDFKQYEALKKRIEGMEWKLQTEALNARQEKELSQEIKKLEKQVPKAQVIEQLLEEIRKAKHEFHAKKASLEKIRQEMHGHARESDRFHEELLKLYKKADSLKEKLGQNIDEIQEVRGEADEKHGTLKTIRKEHMQAMKQKREKEETLTKEELKKRLEEEREKQNELKQKISEQAKEILDSFKSGKKLSFEELQILQASNLI